MLCLALSSSRHTPEDHGILSHAGVFNNAINFLTPHQQLLTLHRYGHGLSPMGWVIDETDFDLIAQVLSSATRLYFDSRGLWLDDLLVKKTGTQCDLTVIQRGKTNAHVLTQSLLGISQQTGLFGPLNAVTAGEPEGELAALQQGFQHWLQGETVDWSAFIGKGPGLTPSNDDTLVGMLLVAFTDNRISPTNLPPFFNVSKPLAELTTLVSNHYLAYASRGIFSTSLLALAQGLLVPQTLLPAIQELLRTGHYSGADSLLGVWLAVQCIDECDGKKTNKIKSRP